MVRRRRCSVRSRSVNVRRRKAVAATTLQCPRPLSDQRGCCFPRPRAFVDGDVVTRRDHLLGRGSLAGARRQNQAARSGARKPHGHRVPSGQDLRPSESVRAASLAPFGVENCSSFRTHLGAYSNGDRSAITYKVGSNSVTKLSRKAMKFDA